VIRHQLGIGALLVTAFCDPVAKADLLDATTYTINFEGTGTLPTAGSFTYDPDTSGFTNFFVTWIGLSFDLTSSANAPSMSPTIPSCLTGLSGGAASFALLSGACSAFWGATSEEIVTANFSFHTEDGSNFLNVFDNLTIPFDFQPMTQAFGGWTITAEATPVPEPSSLIFFSASLLSVAFMARKRIASRMSSQV
jgi:hypothetical protein